jgi:hypothetical protein
MRFGLFAGRIIRKLHERHYSGAKREQLFREQDDESGTSTGFILSSEEEIAMNTSLKVLDNSGGACGTCNSSGCGACVQVPCIERCAYGAVKSWTAYWRRK